MIELEDPTSDGTRVLVVGEPHSGAYIPLVASLRLRITQIVHHSDEDPVQVFVGNVLGTNADKKDCRVAQASCTRPEPVPARAARRPASQVRRRRPPNPFLRSAQLAPPRCLDTPHQLAAATGQLPSRQSRQARAGLSGRHVGDVIMIAARLPAGSNAPNSARWSPTAT